MKAIFENPVEVKRGHLYYLEITSSIPFTSYYNGLNEYIHGVLLYPFISHGSDLVAKIYGINYVSDEYFGVVIEWKNHEDHFWYNDTIFRDSLLKYARELKMKWDEETEPFCWYLLQPNPYHWESTI